jgi:FkbM family methyltransferase
MNSRVKAAARTMHKTIARSRRGAELYLNLLGLLVKPLPDGSWKQHVANGIASVDWPEVRLRARDVSVTEQQRVRLRPHVNEMEFRAHICSTLQYEQEVFEWLETRSYDSIVEIGANVGVYTVFLSRRTGNEGKVYAFEPSFEAYSCLLENLNANKLRNVVPFNCAVCDRSGFVDFFEPAGHRTNGSLYRDFASMFSDKVQIRKVIAINAARVADLFVSSGHNLLKIDVEGAEPIVLGSLGAVIQSFRPDILIEVLNSTEDALNAIRIPERYGYSLYHITREGLLKRDKFHAAECRDYCLLPQ